MTAKTSDPDFLEFWDANVRRHPDHACVVEPARSCSYAQMDSLTSVVAAHLGDLGLGAEQVVGLEFSRPFDFVCGSLAVLKSGAAFTMSASRGGAGTTRRTPLIEFSHSKSWLVRGGAPTGAEREGAIAWLDIAHIERKSPITFSWESKLVSPSQLAYVLFTSGSTGLPKGVMIERSNLSSLCRAVVERLELSGADRWFQLASPGFDVFVEEVFPILVAGGSVICRPSLEVPTFARLQRFLETTETTIMEMTTQYWYGYARWLEATNNSPPSTIRYVIVGGERMDVAAYRRWQTQFSTKLGHVYGITETSVSSTLFLDRLPPTAQDVPVGSPLSNTSLRCGESQSTGLIAEGEVGISGACVGRGYLGAPALTAERFIPNWDGPPGSRVYCSGDTGSLNERGELVLTGRIDDQVKVRGHRLHLSAVERAMNTLPEIDEAVVLRDPMIPTGLAAFVRPKKASVPGHGPAPLVGAQRQAICEALEMLLPEWAIPGRIFMLASFPMGTNGKIDRSALRRLVRLDHGKSEPEHETSLLDVVLAAFRSAMRAPALSIDDNFFDHGGDSLTALTIVGDISAKIDAEFSAALLFEAPTARALAARIAVDTGVETARKQ